MKQRKTLSHLMAIASFGMVAAAQGQTARVQVIHNCADAAASVVDVYVNGGAEPFIDDFEFRTATPFVTVPAGVDLTIGIAPGNSTGPAEIIPGLTFDFNLEDSRTYVLVANGIVSGSGYTPAPAFELTAFAEGREAAEVSTNTDILVLHGSTDAPTVQVAETAVTGGAVIVPAFSYGEFSANYVEVATDDYVLEVQLPDGTPVVAYQAPLETLGLQGAALVAVASGFLDPSVNSDGPAFGIWVALPSGGALVELPLVSQDPTARLQVIHNCADAAASVVDVYVNGGAEPFIDDFEFRTATPFVTVPAGVDLTIGIAPGSSTGPADIIPGLSFDFNLTEDRTYVLVANGIVSGSGYTPAPAFELTVFAEGREAAGVSTNTDILVLHGSTDAPTVQVAETAVTGGAVIVPAFSYGEFSTTYVEVATDDYVLEVQLPDGTPVVAYSAPLATLNLEGAALVAVASGFLNPANNSDGPAFGIWVALPSGGSLIELPIAQDPSARLQVIHNCADAAAEVVDVYVNGGVEPFINDFTFRTATEFVDVPAGVDLVIGIAPGNSTGPDDIIPGLEFTFNLDDGGTYVLVANGIVSATGYTPAPAFELSAFTGGLESSPAGTTSVLVMHGSTDAPVVDVAELQVLDGATLVDDIAYGEFAGYLEVPTANYALQVQTSAGAPVATYAAPLATLGLDGAALTVVASGFLSPANNSDGPAFGLWVALPSGGDLVELPLITNVGINEADEALNVTAWPNPANDVLNVSVDATEQREVTALVTDMTGRVVLEVPSTVINLGENRLQINTAGLSNGMYTLSVVGNAGKKVMAVQVAR